MSELLSVAEYAKLKNVSPQAVYKGIRNGRIKTVSKIENNKTVKYIVPEEPQSRTEPTAARAAEPTAEPPKATESKAANTADATDIIIQQLQIKDAEITRLHDVISQMQKEISAMQSHTEELTKLLDQQQQLQGYTQLLLSDNNEPKKHGAFWHWLFDKTPAANNPAQRQTDED